MQLQTQRPKAQPVAKKNPKPDPKADECAERERWRGHHRPIRTAAPSCARREPGWQLFWFGDLVARGGRSVDERRLDPTGEQPFPNVVDPRIAQVSSRWIPATLRRAQVSSFRVPVDPRRAQLSPVGVVPHLQDRIKSSQAASIRRSSTAAPLMSAGASRQGANPINLTPISCAHPE